MPRLIPQPEVLDDLTVAVDVRPLHVVQQTAAVPDHLQQPAAAMMVFLVSPEVLGEVVDPLGEQGDLDSRGAGVRLVLLVLLERRGVVKSHWLNRDKLVEPCKLAQAAQRVKKGTAQPKSRATTSRTPLARSLNVDIAKISSMATSPKRRMYSRVRALNGRPFTDSATLIRICPPSRIGIGSRLRTATFTLRTAISRKRLSTPLCAAATDARVIAMGPPSCRTETSRVRRPRTTATIFVAVSHVCRAPSPNAVPIAIGWRLLKSASVAPIFPTDAICFVTGSFWSTASGRTVNVRGTPWRRTSNAISLPADGATRA